MFTECIVPRLATALGLTAAFAILTLLAAPRSPDGSVPASDERA